MHHPLPVLKHALAGHATRIRSRFKTTQLAPYGVKNRLKMLIYSYVNCASSPIFALSCTHLSNFETTS
jgi:hypothetical protein